MNEDESHQWFMFDCLMMWSDLMRATQGIGAWSWKWDHGDGGDLCRKRNESRWCRGKVGGPRLNCFNVCGHTTVRCDQNVCFVSHWAMQDVVRKMAKYDEFFINVMMVEELGLQVPDPDDDTVKEGKSRVAPLNEYAECIMSHDGCASFYDRCHHVPCLCWIRCHALVRICPSTFSHTRFIRTCSFCHSMCCYCRYPLYHGCSQGMYVNCMSCVSTPDMCDLMPLLLLLTYVIG